MNGGPYSWFIDSTFDVVQLASNFSKSIVNLTLDSEQKRHDEPLHELSCDIVASHGRYGRRECYGHRGRYGRHGRYGRYGLEIHRTSFCGPELEATLARACLHCRILKSVNKLDILDPTDATDPTDMLSAQWSVIPAVHHCVHPSVHLSVCLPV